MGIVKGTLLAVRFALELSALAALAYWGFETGGGTATKILLGIGAPVAAIVVWSLFVSPKARFRHPVLKLVFEIVVFGGAVAALWAADRPQLALVFAAVAVVDTVLVYALDA